jgi:DNA-binding NtrC family response regulator
MEACNVVLYQKDPGTAQSLAVGLSRHFATVHLANTCQEVRPAIARHRAEVVVLDLETSGPDEVRRLHHEFPRLCIVGTHRLADDQLWTEALSLGAADICEPRHDDNVNSILRGLTNHAAA